MDSMVIDGGNNQDCLLVTENQIFLYDDCGGTYTAHSLSDVQFEDPHIYVSPNEILILAQNLSPPESLHIWAIRLNGNGQVTSNQRIPITSMFIIILLVYQRYIKN